MKTEPPRIFTRRDLLRGAGLAGAAAVAAPLKSGAAAEAGTGADAVQANGPAASRREALENLTAAESDLLEAILDRLIPSDEHGPGARDARVVHYIDRALGGALADQKPAYTAGLAALDRYAESSRGTRFLDLSDRDKDSVLMDCETGQGTGFAGSSAQFFALLLAHTRQGMFGDPYYGGNANFAGWDLLGYPGVRTMVTPADQRALETGAMTPVRRSAYDVESFNKATVHDDTHGREHGTRSEE